ncbi:MAG: MlaD family protein [Sulfuricella sp.]|nr:MlaD family protein [Sulfuricella sp.]
MESKVNFTVVGLFTLLLSAALVAILLWLGSSGKYYKTYDTYYVYTSESVSGLNLNAPVKLRGVEVGLVHEIALDPTDSERVLLLLKIERGTPVKADSVAVLRTQGLTGIAYVELTGGSRQSPLLTPAPGEKYPVIRSGPSLMTRLDAALTGLLASINRISDSVNAVLDEDNRRAFKRSLAQIDQVTHALAVHSPAIEAGMDNAAKTLEHSARASADLERLIERAGRSADAIERAANEAAHTASEASRATTAVPDTLRDIHLLVEDLRELSASMRRTSEQIENNPNALLFGKPRPKPGPGE